ncbi:protein eva-1 isoform X2 [Halyomorpha halys]|uniref:protein eva-1 isoform X2 n=1 Tax=Halyomorpha halys TaxID=286706 RepID=UPI0006D4D661|nr:protein eva-1-like isoform X2 [Halyomorpha halys]
MLHLIAVILCSSFPLLASSDDNLELLSASLRQLQRSGCQELSLSCPQGTSIALVSARYSKDVYCPGVEYNRNCLLQKSLQYSLLQTAVERCQKKRHCKLMSSSNNYGIDPCPGVPKHLQITFSCRPYEFRSKTACENEMVHLQCGPNSRLAIYSASYGRTQYESLQCPQPQGVPEETCLASYATETVINMCHGKRRCTLSVDSSTFGNPCKKESRMYLKVVFTCVPRKVLLPKYEQGQEEDEALEPADEWVDYDEEELAAPNTIGQHNISTAANESVTLHHNRGGYIPTSEPDEEDTSADNKERLSLYLAVSIGGGLICLLGLLVLRMAWSSRKRSRSQQPVPPFVGELYDGETDLGIATALPIDPGDVVRYSAMDMPRSLAAANSQYYYG